MDWLYFTTIITVVIIKLNALKTNNNTLQNIWNSMDWGPLPKDPSNIGSILYYRFADKSTGISSAAFKNFVDCIHGDSDCYYPSENLQGRFVVLTDCEINSALSPEECNLLHKCSRVNDIVSILPSLDVPNKVLDEEDFNALLPAIVYQMHSNFCKENDLDVEAEPSLMKPTNTEVWGYGILFVTLISGCSLAGVSVLPLMAREFYQKLLTVLIGLAVGSLAASAVFHLIPQAYNIIDEEQHENYLFLSLCILMGIWAFFMIERVLKVIFTIQKVMADRIPASVSAQAIVSKPTIYCPAEGSCRNGGSFDCGSSCRETVNCDENKPVSLNNVQIDCGIISNGDAADLCSSNSNKVQLIYVSQEQAIKASFGHEEKPERSLEMYDFQFRQGKDSVIATVAWMIIFGDGFHNFIDGVSIGAAFQESILTGISISLAVMCEELPHELGDFAVLLNSGMTMKQALFYNFLSATTCYMGMIVGILIGEFTQNSTYIFALAAGMFLYISLVDMLPEMNETATKAAEKSVWDVINVLFLQNVGLFLGVFSLFLLAYYQDKITLG